MGRTRWLRPILAVLAFLLTTVATLLFFAQDRFLDSDDFGATAAASLSDPAINNYLAGEISDALIEEAPNLATGGSLLESLTSGVLESSVAQGAVQASVTEAHRTVFEEDADSFVIAVSDVVLMLDQTLKALVPDMADMMPSDVEEVVVAISSGEMFTGLIDGARALRKLTAVIAILAFVALLALIVTDRNPWTGISTTGLTLGAVGLFILVLQVVGAIVVGSFAAVGPQRDAVVAAWQLVFGELQTWGWMLMAAGAFLAGFAWAVVNVGHARSAVVEQFQRLSSRPRTKAGTSARLVAVGGAAVWAVFEPLTLAAVAIRIVGFIAAVAVVAEIVEMTGLGKRISALTPDDGDVRSWRSLGGQALFPASIIGGLAVAAVFTLSADPMTISDSRNDTCNGHEILCARRFDEVAIVASHNSMSSTDANFYLPNQTSTMVEQLDQGVRGLLIDTWYGRPDGNGVIVTETDFVNLDDLDARTRTAVEAARARATLGERDVYLCHSLCEVGALPAAEALADVRAWLQANPREVVTIVVQDATAPEDTASVFEQAGLEPFAHRQTFGQPFPTLEEMIERDKRLFVLVEEDPGDIPWLHPAFEFVQETPFSFGSAAEFSCERNRGRDDSPLFMVNHFITPALNANRVVNLTETLLPRLRQCEDERGVMPTVIAADFVAYGDLMTVVDELNGVTGD